MKTLSLKVSPALDAKLAAVARQQGASKSAVLRKLLERYLVSEKGRPPSPLVAAAAELVGCIEGSPNLSSEPRRLKGYGR